MTYDEILALLTANNARTSGFLTVDEIRSLVASASVDLPGGPGTGGFNNQLHQYWGPRKDVAIG
jgi:hypothetical protein